MQFQLRAYQTEASHDNTPAPVRRAPATEHAWVDVVLDLDVSLDIISEERTLEAEVDAYLGEPLTKTASLDYWKVCVF